MRAVLTFKCCIENFANAVEVRTRKSITVHESQLRSPRLTLALSLELKPGISLWE